jgi:hypothetical protein
LGLGGDRVKNRYRITLNLNDLCWESKSVSLFDDFDVFKVRIEAGNHIMGISTDIEAQNQSEAEKAGVEKITNFLLSRPSTRKT